MKIEFSYEDTIDEPLEEAWWRIGEWINYISWENREGLKCRLHDACETHGMCWVHSDWDFIWSAMNET